MREGGSGVEGLGVLLVAQNGPQLLHSEALVAGLQPLAQVGLRNKAILVGPPSSSNGQQRRWNKKGGKRKTEGRGKENGRRGRGEGRNKGRRRPRETQTSFTHKFRPSRWLPSDTMPTPLSISPSPLQVVSAQPSLGHPVVASFQP